MSQRPIPHRFPPLTWRRPAFVWTPLALVIAIGWPALALNSGGGMQKMSLVAGSATFALALVSLGFAWFSGNAPRTHREVIRHILGAGTIVALLAPFALTEVLSAVSNAEHDGHGQSFGLAAPASLIPLALLLGLPIALISAIAFSLFALSKPGMRENEDAVFSGRGEQRI